MTTIAFKDGQLAADTLIAYNTITNGCREKISECGEYVVALAGMTWLRFPLEEWCEAGCPPHEVPTALLEYDEAFTALIVKTSTGEVFEYANGYLLPIHADYTAIGSGAILAIGAMAHGATAEEAVVAASKHDKNTGGPVTSINFNLAA